MTQPRFATIRLLVLLACLVVVGFTALHQRVYSRNWNQTLEAVVYPINGDDHLATNSYIQNLNSDDFAIINRWGEREAERYALALPTPFKVTLGEQISNLPPTFPDKANAVKVLIWGLRFRLWAWRNTPDDGGLTRVRMFVVYQTGEDNKALQHSLGMQKGLMGLVFAYSLHKQTAQNNIIIAHELLHTVGATDKYNAYGGPLMGIGYANSNRIPLYPQRNAEIMAGRIPTSSSSSYMAESLRSVVINTYTASEINWID
ncbi:hypothetical protein [Granulosicoccus antarcticus]|uniref:Uncharacterized protein n=1 Tax=Granulosicoccus antarcticus IMCC3135 TaxID=1192854 RepID=A0A2Z2P5B9_9GAMM|nr:hypothetical protein [Granulosicoccus antarcticus]ASJ76690.1 hypothetical protein IMCC3135_33230 [Granulosicoccus antarcticus IMCC3135]